MTSTFPLEGKFVCISPGERTALLNRVQELMPSLTADDESKIARIQTIRGVTYLHVEAEAMIEAEALAFFDAVLDSAVEHAAMEDQSSAWLRERADDGTIVQDLRGWGNVPPAE